MPQWIQRIPQLSLKNSGHVRRDVETRNGSNVAIELAAIIRLQTMHDNLGLSNIERERDRPREKEEDLVSAIVSQNELIV